MTCPRWKTQFDDKHSITFETYIYDDSSIADEFTEAFAERARQMVCMSTILPNSLHRAEQLQEPRAIPHR